MYANFVWLVKSQAICLNDARDTETWITEGPGSGAGSAFTTVSCLTPDTSSDEDMLATNDSVFRLQTKNNTVNIYKHNGGGQSFSTKHFSSPSLQNYYLFFCFSLHLSFRKKNVKAVQQLCTRQNMQSLWDRVRTNLALTGGPNDIL